MTYFSSAAFEAKICVCNVQVIIGCFISFKNKKMFERYTIATDPRIYNEKVR